MKPSIKHYLLGAGNTNFDPAIKRDFSSLEKFGVSKNTTLNRHENNPWKHPPKKTTKLTASG